MTDSLPDQLFDQLQVSLGSSYHIERELGGGGMSRVFVAEETRFGRTVVIKVLTQELAHGLSAERFEREIKLAAQLQQANIVPVLGAGEIAPADGSAALPYYTMPFVDGESLRARLAKGLLSLGESIAILRDVARALAYAHAHGVVHRDIKPENVLLSGGAAVVTDFGIAKALSASKTQAPGGTLTVVGTSLGTPAYMAPEQAVGDHVDERADIYAWGVLAYELLAGAHPFAGKTTAQQLIAAHIAEQPRELSEVRAGVPPALSALVMRCLDKAPGKRPQSASEILHVLENPGLLGGTAPTVSGSRVRARRSTVRSVTAAVVTLVILGAVISTRGRIGSALHLSALVGNLAASGHTGAITTVAVLPFVNTGGNATDEYFSDGMTDELAHALSRLPSLRVAGRTSSYAFQGKEVPAQQIGRTLNVAGIVEGTVRRAGDRLRITAQLTSATDGLVVWSDTYESSAADVFQMQDQFTREIVSALEPALRGKTAATVADASRGTTDLAAYELYLKGRYFWAKRGGANIARSIDYFKQAIARDPGFARAHAGLAMAYVVLPYFVVMNADSALALAVGSATRALSIDSVLGDAHVALCGARSLMAHFAEAEQQCRAALAIEPNDPTALQWHSENLARLGRLAEALAESEHAAALDPLSPVIADAVSIQLYQSRNFTQAVTEAHHILQLDSSFTFAYVDLALPSLFAGNGAAAAAAADTAFQRDSTLPGIRGILVMAYAGAGRWSDAERVRAAIELAHKRRQPRKGDSLSYDDLAAALAFGVPPAERASVIRRIDWTNILVTSFGPCDPLFDPLKGDPAFITVMQQLGSRVCPGVSPWPIKPRTQ